ncbi:MarR family winged helix-turn-helix transcriptional regulator [Paenibacillus septentrionalis]|uniref:MarR family winged helix-turn-helix transcriptional regulator n=1 Tax=Paenibacillus septentrionalis TaxID=429342 RepID=A0ABW1V963_9BACL
MDKSHQELKELFLMFKNIDRRITQCFEKRAGISLTRYELLYKLLTKGKITQISLQQELNIDQAAITRHLKLLEEQQLVHRQRNELNNREIIVEITDIGKQLLTGCDGDRQQFINELYRDFTTEEVEQLQALVRKLNYNTDRL